MCGAIQTALAPDGFPLALTDNSNWTVLPAMPRQIREQAEFDGCRRDDVLAASGLTSGLIQDQICHHHDV